jgi:D-xylonolactonase
MHAKLVVDCPGRAPLWHPDEQQLYWVAAAQSGLIRLDPLTGHCEPCYLGDVPGGFAVQADGALLLFRHGGSVTLLRGQEETRLIEEIPADRETTFSSVIADPTGRGFAATVGADGSSGRLYRIETDGALALVLEGLDWINGMGFTPDRTHFYVADTHARTIYRFDYDQVTGELGHRHVFAEALGGELEGRPEGLTVDAEGSVWSARWGGGCVVRYSSDGTEEERIALPTPNVSGIAFGGSDFDDLYVTTDRALYRLHPGVNGLPPFRSQVLGDAGLW